MARAQAKKLGARAAERRRELGLTQPDIADRMTDFPKVSNQQVSNWERGIHTPQEERLEAWAAALETTVADLYAGPMADREEGGPTPDPFEAMNGQLPADLEGLRTQLDRIEANQRTIWRALNALLTAQEIELALQGAERDRLAEPGSQPDPGGQQAA